jgi:methyl-accepting chemotaxis protein
MKFDATSQGAEELRKAGNDLENSRDAVINAIREVQSVAADHPNELGSHIQSLNEALENIHSNIEKTVSFAGNIAGQLSDIADSYDEISSTDKIEASSGSVGRNESLIWQQDRDI